MFGGGEHLSDRFQDPVRDGTGEEGLSLIEILVALGIPSVVLIALGSLMFQVARHTRRSAAAGGRSAAVTSVGSWANSVTWDSVDASVGCQLDTSGLLVYTRCITVQQPAPHLKEIEVIISAVGPLMVRPDTVRVYRTKPKAVSPFNVN